MYTYAFHTSTRTGGWRRQQGRMPPKKKEEEVDRLTRIAIVNKDKCKPKKCRQVCCVVVGVCEGWGSRQGGVGR